MNQEQALITLINAVKAATLKGAYSLEDAAIIAQAVSIFTKKPDEPGVKQAEVPSKKK